MSEREKEVIKNTKEEVVEFVKQYGIKVVPIGTNKNPIPDDWTNPKVYEPMQEVWLEQFLKEKINVGFIGGAKCKNGKYFAVIDADSKDVWKKVKELENKTTVVKSGGESQPRDPPDWISKGISKEISRHLYFFTDTPARTLRKHEDNIQVDIIARGGQVCSPMYVHPKTGRKYTFMNKIAPMVWEGDFEFDVKKLFGIGTSETREKVNISEILLGVSQGDRDNAAIRVATYYRKQGKTQEETFKLMKEWNQRNKPPYGTAHGDENEDTWINTKIASAWKMETPYAWDFVEEEIYTDEEMVQVEKLLKEPEQIPYFIYKATADVVGEDKNRVAVVILNFGKQSMEISGKSAAGKNKVADSCLKCFSHNFKGPEVKKVTGLTDKSLRYMKEPPQTLYIAERRGFEGSIEETSVEYDVKVGISEGEIKTLYVNRETMETEEKVIPVGNFVFTSTEITPPTELANRIFNLTVDDSPEQNYRVVKFKLQQWTKPPKERVNTEPQKKILRLLFKKLRQMNLKDEQFIIPWAELLQKLLPCSETAIRRHTDKLVGAIVSIAKLMHTKLEKSNDSFIVPPEILWYVFRICDEAIFTQVVGMTKTQITYWSTIQKLFEVQQQLSIRDVQNKIKRSRQTITLLFDFLEEAGLITTRIEGREKIAELAEQTGEPSKRQTDGFGFADLQKEYEKWCRNKPSSRQSLKLIDPFTGEDLDPELTLRRFKFEIKLQPVQIRQVAKPSSKQTDGSAKPLEDFNNASQS